MSEKVRKIGATTVLMWMVGLFMFPVVAYVASNAVEVPEIETQIEAIGRTQIDIKNQLTDLSNANATQHHEIINMLSKHSAHIMALQIKCEQHKEIIKELKKKHHMLNGQDVWK